MDAYDSSGRRISLLSNDEEYSFNDTPYSAHEIGSSGYKPSTFGAPAYTPGTPELVRSHSIGSQSTHPDTPSMTEADPFNYRRISEQSVPDYDMVDLPAMQYHDQPKTHQATHSHFGAQQTVNAQQSQPQGTQASPPTTSKKQYLCRLSKEYNCDKKFTTSGHASRHAKIHLQNKHIQCTFEGCTKTFTRTDNMKQHLETHNRNRNGGKSGGNKARRQATRRRSDVSASSRRESTRSVSVSSQSQHHSPYPVFSDVSYQFNGSDHRVPPASQPLTGMAALLTAAHIASENKDNDDASKYNN